LEIDKAVRLHSLNFLSGLAFDAAVVEKMPKLPGSNTRDIVIVPSTVLSAMFNDRMEMIIAASSAIIHDRWLHIQRQTKLDVSAIFLEGPSPCRVPILNPIESNQVDNQNTRKFEISGPSLHRDFGLARYAVGEIFVTVPLPGKIDTLLKCPDSRATSGR
jgi:hypothetical protein